MQHEALAKITETLAKAATIYGRTFNSPSVSFDLRGRTAGQYFPALNKIRLNYTLMRENREHFISQTIPHEVAHLVTRAIYGPFVKSHGNEWKSVMLRFGLKPDRCHTYDTTNTATRRTQKFTLHCACMSHQVGAKVYGKIKAGARYTCKKCKTAVTEQAGAMQLTKRGLGRFVE